jgi:pullulanase/glycogen debranching enzyme
LDDSECQQALYVMINAYHQALPFTIESPGAWHQVVDTSRASPNDIVPLADAKRVVDPVYLVGPQSVVVLAR